jgi:hypothetical protein
MMKIDDLVKSAEFLTNEKGQKKVVLDWEGSTALNRDACCPMLKTSG